MSESAWSRRAAELADVLGLTTPPLAVTLAMDGAAETVPAYDVPAPEPLPDGRTGRVPAGCVFWMRAAERTFRTDPADHANCSVGMVTHGLATLEEVAGNDDVKAALATGWITLEQAQAIPHVAERPRHVVYGPLSETPIDPDVVLLRLNGRQLMLLSDALPGLRIEGKPQCHIIAVAREQGEPAASVGCALSRARTGMPSAEMTCAIPAPALDAVLERLRAATEADRALARHAAADARRFQEA